MATHRSPDPVRPLFVVGFDADEAHKVIHGLAVAKVLAERAEIGYRYDPLVSFLTAWGGRAPEPVALTVGENFNKLQFDRWVKEEENVQWGRYCDAGAKSPADAIRWMYGAWRARQSYYHAYQDRIEEANRINAEIGEILQTAKRFALVSKTAAEIGLTWIGVGAPTVFGMKFAATMSVAWEKLAFEVGRTAVETVVEHVAQPRSAEDESQDISVDIGGFLEEHGPDLLVAAADFRGEAAEHVASNAMKVVTTLHKNYGWKHAAREARKLRAANEKIAHGAVQSATVFAGLATCVSVYDLWEQW